MIGPTPNIENQGRDEKVHREIKTIADVILQAFKSGRQVAHTPKSSSTEFRTQRDWPLQLGIGVAVHQSTRSKHLVNLLHGYGLSVDYARILRLETQLAHSIAAKTTKEGLYVPPTLQQGHFIFFAIDNSLTSTRTLQMGNIQHMLLQLPFFSKHLKVTRDSQSLQPNQPANNFRTLLKPNLLNATCLHIPNQRHQQMRCIQWKRINHCFCIAL